MGKADEPFDRSGVALLKEGWYVQLCCHCIVSAIGFPLVRRHFVDVHVVLLTASPSTTECVYCITISKDPIIGRMLLAYNTIT